MIGHVIHDVRPALQLLVNPHPFEQLQRVLLQEMCDAELEGLAVVLVLEEVTALTNSQQAVYRGPHHFERPVERALALELLDHRAHNQRRV